MKPSVFNDPRTKRLAYRLGISHLESLGLVYASWDFAEEYYPDGKFPLDLADDLCIHVGWSADRPSLIDALTYAGWLISADMSAEFVDFGHVKTRRARDRLRKRERRTLSAENGQCPRTTVGNCGQKVGQNGVSADNASNSEVRGGRGGVFGPGECAEDTEQKAKPSVALGSAFEELRVLWNKTPGTIPCRQSNPDRLKKLSTRLKEDAYRDYWREALSKFPLPMFDRPPRGDGTKHWTPTIDWFLTPSKVVQIVEGKYDAVIDRDNKQQPLSSNLYDLLPQELETHE